jgi:hypothetical protein
VSTLIVVHDCNLCVMCVCVCDNILRIVIELRRLQTQYNEYKCSEKTKVKSILYNVLDTETSVIEGAGSKDCHTT